MSFVLGLDSGGSKTVAAVADANGAVLRTWKGPGLDPQYVADWERLLGEAVADLCNGETPSAAVLGLPMHGEIEALSERQRSAAETLLACPHLVLNDVEIACDGAFAGTSGVLVLAGTGSMAWAKAHGKSIRVGGWGDAFGDEGSAFWIGREALSLASQAIDGRIEAQSFWFQRLVTCGVGAEKLVDWAYSQQNSRAAIAGLALQVDAMAEEGNETAISLLQTAAGALSAHVGAARRKLGDASLIWSHGGSVFRSSTVMERLSSLVGPPAEPRMPPVGGALWRAAIAAGWSVDDRFIASLSACLDKS